MPDDALDSELNPAEKRLLAEYAARIEAGDLTADEECWAMDYVTQPPAIHEFILDDYYLGRSLRPIVGENEGIWPEWLRCLSRDFDLNSRIHNMVITGSLGIGKCWGPDDELVMFDGTLKRARDVVRGDVLIGDDSTPRTVLSTTRGRGKMYTVHPVKGEPFRVNGDHILVLKSTVSDEIEEVSVKDFLAWPRQKKAKACLYRVAVDWAEAALPIDPYVFGMWLGDGHTSQTALTTADPELADVWIGYGRSLGLTPNRYPAGKKNKSDVIQLSARRADGSIVVGGNPLISALQSLGLMLRGQENTKFIPQCYTTNSRRNRLELLAGLIDTDGSKARAGGEGVYEITFSVKRLADDVRFLARSLGYYAQTKIKVVNSTAYFRTTISGAYDIPTRLDRKKSGVRGRRISNLTGGEVGFDISKTRFAIIPEDEGDYYGFTLTGDGRCLMRDFTVTHNTLMAVVLILYRVCIATHLRNPQNFFGISRNSKIVYNFLSVTKAAVRETAFGDAMDLMAVSPYFVEVCGFDPDSDYSGFRIPMLNQLPDGRVSNIWMSAGSKGQHILGRNVVGVVLDEGNFRLEKDPDLKAYALYDSVRTRISNRFQKLATFLPALSVIASSAADESSFTEKVVTEIEQQQADLAKENERRVAQGMMPNEPTQLIYRHAVYKIKRHALLDIGPNHRWFKVAHGLKNMEPFILTGWYHEDGTPIGEDAHEEPPKGAKTELVPEFYHEAYRRNCRTNLQALSGISTGGAHRLFPNIIDIEWCLAQSKEEGVPDNVKTGIERISLSNEDNLNLWDFLEHRKFVTLEASRYRPIRHPERKRYAHLDLATQGLAGLSICHLVGSQLVDGLFKSGQPFSEYRLTVEYDFILTICAGETKPISIDKIQRFFFWLRDTCGFQFGLITADMFQCLTGDALVNTGRGLVRMDAVRIGDVVASRAGPRRVKNVFKYTDVPVLEVVTNHGARITGTPNHRISAAHPRARWLKPQYGWMRLDELRVGDQVEMVAHPVCVESTTSTGFTLDQVEWLGLFWANGCASERNGLRLSVNADDVDEAVDLSVKAWGIEPSVYADSSDCLSSCVQIHSVDLVRRLVGAGFAKPAVKCPDGFKGSVGLPAPVLMATRAEKSRFLKGLYAGDGNVGKVDGCVSLSTKHRVMAEQVAVVMLTEFGIQTDLVESLRDGYGGLSVQYLLRARGPRQLFAERINFSFRRKTAALALHVGRPGRQIKERVESIRPLRADVYDLEVEEDHSYTANGFVSHNSEASLQMLEAKGFEVDRRSIDRDKSAYHMWREGFEEHRIRLARNAQMIREAEALLDMDKKYDHPPDGSKDTTDSAAGAYANAMESDEKASLIINNDPVATTSRQLRQAETHQAPPVEIIIPSGGSRLKVFEA